MIRESLSYVVKRSLKNIRSSPFASVMNVVVLTGFFILLGVALAVIRGVGEVAPPWVADTQAVAYLRPEVSVGGRDRLVRELEQWPEVDQVRSVSGEEAWKRLRGRLEDRRESIEGLRSAGESPPPAWLEITFGPKGKARSGGVEALVVKIGTLQEIDRVYHSRVWADKVQPFQSVLKFACMGAAGLICLATVLTASFATRLTVSARRDEIAVLSIVGATPLYIKAPLYIEGVVQGLVSAGVAGGTIAWSFAAWRGMLPEQVASALVHTDLDASSFLLVLLACGAVLSLAGCWLALRSLCVYR